MEVRDRGSNLVKYKDNTTRGEARQQLDILLCEIAQSYPVPPMDLNIGIDIGANLGAFSLRYHKHFKKIIAIEPNIDNCVVLKHFLQERGITNVDVYCYAVNDTCGTVKLYRGEGEDISGNASTTNAVGEYEEVQALDFKGVFELAGEPLIDYMKIDCEGAEYKFLQDQDLSNIACISGEYHGVGKEIEENLWNHIRKTHRLNRVPNKNVFYAFHNECP